MSHTVCEFGVIGVAADTVVCRQGRTETALLSLNEALSLQNATPDLSTCDVHHDVNATHVHLNLARLLLSKGEADEALSHAVKGVLCAWSPSTWWEVRCLHNSLQVKTGEAQRAALS